MSHERVRNILAKELFRQPATVSEIIIAHFCKDPVYKDIEISTGQAITIDLSDISHSLIALFRDCEPEVSCMMKHSLSNGDTFVDGGANIGLKTGIGHSIVSESGTVIAVEPTLETYRVLKHNADRWSSNTINTYQFALSDKSGKATLTDYGHKRSGLNTLSSIPREKPKLTGKTVEVNTITLDELVGNRNPSLIKLDVEGYEHKAIVGFLDYIRQYHPDIIFETGNPDTSEIFKLLSKMRYKFYGSDGEAVYRIDIDLALETLNVLASSRS